MYKVFSEVNHKEVAARIWWETQQKYHDIIRVFYDRQDKFLIAITPEDSRNDKLIYDPGRYIWIGQYNQYARPEYIEQDFDKLKSELYQPRIQSSLGKHIDIMRLEDDT